ncbi:MAG: Fe-S cluster assembly ATPase SufC [Alphaproteobacteria bacterium TMED150]|nr:Fe-S cluster assembly ATPase SufC [Paracoccaceae bacterium]RPH14606.1 MAG: Fe-S cluster assembly ATPase SufC [Alphaproteobacteria bacterium TMED150]
MLEVCDLAVEIGGKRIINGMNLVVPAGEVHAIMGPNGAGKSTLSYAMAGRPGYDIVGGDILLDGQSMLGLDVSERAAAGMFLALQYPVEIPGVANMSFLKTALESLAKARGQEKQATVEFMRQVKAEARALQISEDMLRRPLNVGFSGGEKKRNEALQLAMLAPKMAVLDETDSGLDIDALKIVAEGVNRMRDPARSFLVITHYQRLLDYIVPDQVHVLAAGKIVASGGADLARELEESGYAAYEAA